MARTMLGVFTAVAAALLLVGVAWAGTDGAGEEMSATDATIATVPDQQVTTPTAAEDRAVNEIGDDTTSALISEEDEDDDTASALISEEDEDDDTASASISEEDEDDDTMSASISEEDEDESHEIFEDQLVVYDIPGVGSVTVEIVAGRLELVNVSAPGWDVEVKTADPDEVEVKIRNGSDEVEFEAEIERGKIKIEIESS